ncbi:MAG TPA: prenyltransferase/squalene oxidase repeat-containing protein [Pirellulales bacterium]|nr:prenyltransferase/squalene oxidase repeat-containing protein [Pirellulales bacterium]
MKTCPACHRSVPEGAAICPHPGCGQALDTPRPKAKRPPPPPTHLQIGGHDGHGASPQTVAPHTASARTRFRWPLLIWPATILIGSALVAAVLLAYLPSPHHEQEIASTGASSPRLQPKREQASAAPASGRVSNRKSATTPAVDTDKPPQDAANGTEKAGNAPAPKMPADAQPSSNKPDESLGIVADQPKEPPADGGKSTVDKKPTGLVADPAAKPEPMGLPEEPPVGVVADTPKALYAERTKPKTPEWLAERGGTVESQAAVEEGLNWLARHQSPDGHWGADCLGTDPNSRCDRKAPCQGPGEAYEAAQTGLALLAFQAAGHYYFNGQKYSDEVKRGLDYLVEEQAPDGSIVGSQNPSSEQIKAGANFQQYFMYEHAIATFALCEGCAVAVAEGQAPDRRYLSAARRAVQFIEHWQHSDGGWRYTRMPTEQSDCSVSGWVMLALKTAREAQIQVPQVTVLRMTAFFSSHYGGRRTYYLNEKQPGTAAMTGVGMMAAEFFGRKTNPSIASGAAFLVEGAEELKARGALTGSDYYLWYNCTMAMFQAGGEPWQRWNGLVRDYVVSLQVQGSGCDRGSWPPNDQWSSRGGRIYSTALAVLTLEVYYRFQRIAGQPEKAKFFEK